MVKKKKDLLSSAPWRGEESGEADKFKDAKTSVTSQPGATPTMHYNKPSNKPFSDGDDLRPEIDPELRYSFQRNYQFLQKVFTIDTIVKPLPTKLGDDLTRNWSFFTRIFTQFFDPDGIANAQKAIGLGQQEERANPRVR
ncbi:hypothetical protein Vadar_024340 [Vaccinium darrowii]|uniref:Uncharacterized protein n=1 Tax=Vaccinium darrowii TaxID=229202 RepID=A0ACB7ZEX9_9ERIC|nr:hypothetical protein Vadar_024340 [Vaccinium darrowii]